GTPPPGSPGVGEHGAGGGAGTRPAGRWGRGSGDGAEGGGHGPRACLIRHRSAAGAGTASRRRRLTGPAQARPGVVHDTGAGMRGPAGDNLVTPWGYGAVGSASRSQREGRGFESP